MQWTTDNLHMPELEESQYIRLQAVPVNVLSDVSNPGEDAPTISSWALTMGLKEESRPHAGGESCRR